MATARGWQPPQPTFGARIWDGSCRYLPVEGLVGLADLHALLVAPGRDEVEDGLLVTACRDRRLGGAFSLTAGSHPPLGSASRSCHAPNRSQLGQEEKQSQGAAQGGRGGGARGPGTLLSHPYPIPSWHCTAPLRPGWHRNPGTPSPSPCRPGERRRGDAGGRSRRVGGGRAQPRAPAPVIPFGCSLLAVPQAGRA